MSHTPLAFAELLQKSLSSRTVYLRCHPAPVNFFERRAVLRAVQKLTHETVETFKKLEDNSSFVIVTTKAGTATALVNDSPFTRVFITEEPNSSWGAEYDMRGYITTPINPIPPSRATKSTPTLFSLGLSPKTFTLHMFAANKTYNHKEAVRRNPLHGPWPSNDSKETYMSAALRNSIPSGAMAPALRDWHAANQLWRDSISFADEGTEGAAAVLLGKKRLSPKEVFLMERIRARRNDEGTPAIMKGLAAYANRIVDDLPSTPNLPSETKTSPEGSGGWPTRPKPVARAEPSIRDAPNNGQSDLGNPSIDSFEAEIERKRFKG
ncbi:hypothetical protein F4804DRAFT_113118 [Jackrogersella minutella]|nr:hypothetical protein F4804DRAFT_113118 [Jackrogersella minutella]